MIKTSLLSAAAVLALASGVDAGGVTLVQVEPVVTVAPVQIAPAFEWSGGYVGGILATNSAESSTGDISITADPLAVIPGISYASDGLSAGIEVGYNFQSNSLIYGLELDSSKAAVDGSLSNNLMTAKAPTFLYQPMRIGSPRHAVGLESLLPVHFFMSPVALLPLGGSVAQILPRIHLLNPA